MNESVKIMHLGRQAYSHVWQQQKAFTHARTSDTVDEFWLVEHDPVYTQGQAGKPEHILDPGTIPIVQSDRGGQVTYHGPGQLIIYFLVDLRRKHLDIRQFVDHLEQAIIDLLASYNINAATKHKAPGVYIDGAKVCSIGLRVRKGCTYHGLSLNVAMDLEPFTRIHPCGYSDLRMTQLADFAIRKPLDHIGTEFLTILGRRLGYNNERY